MAGVEILYCTEEQCFVLFLVLLFHVDYVFWDIQCKSPMQLFTTKLFLPCLLGNLNRFRQASAAHTSAHTVVLGENPFVINQLWAGVGTWEAWRHRLNLPPFVNPMPSFIQYLQYQPFKTPSIFPESSDRTLSFHSGEEALRCLCPLDAVLKPAVLPLESW